MVTALKMKIEFYKYHGCGNDFIIIDELEKQIVPDELKGDVSKTICRRRYSIGADDVLYLVPSNNADAWMRIFEPDGSEAEMCGNGIRCAAKYLFEKNRIKKVKIETKAGIREVEKIGEKIKVNMGPLQTRYHDLKDFVKINLEEDEEIIDRKMKFPIIGEIRISIVNTGEPHAVVFVDNIEKEDINKYANAISKNRKLFPKGISVNLVQAIGVNCLRVRTYERGVWGETLACGTGATASAAVAYILNKVNEKKINVKVQGGELQIIIDKNLYMIGPAKKVFKGEIELELRKNIRSFK